MIDEIFKQKNLNKGQIEKIKKLNLDLETFLKLIENINSENFESEIKFYSGKNFKKPNYNNSMPKSREDIISDQTDEIIFAIKEHFERGLQDFYNGKIEYIQCQKLKEYCKPIEIFTNCKVKIKDVELIAEQIKELLTNVKWVNVPKEVYQWIFSKGLHNVLSMIFCNYYYNKSNWNRSLFEFVSEPTLVNEWFAPEFNYCLNREGNEKFLQKIKGFVKI